MRSAIVWCAVLGACGARAAPPSPEADFADGATEVRCYAGIHVWRSYARRDPAVETPLRLRRTVAPSFSTITEEWRLGDAAPVIRDLVVGDAVADGVSLTIRTRGVEDEGVGELQGGTPWHWTNWSWSIELDGQRESLLCELTGSTLTGSGAIGGVHGIEEDFDTSFVLEAFDCSNW
jgi:hypothetical protein